MGVAALICWFITALAGLYLVAVWLIENDVGEQGTVASRLPGPVILAHVLLALTGLSSGWSICCPAPPRGGGRPWGSSRSSPRWA